MNNHRIRILVFGGFLVATAVALFALLPVKTSLAWTALVCVVAFLLLCVGVAWDVTNTSRRSLVEELALFLEVRKKAILGIALAVTVTVLEALGILAVPAVLLGVAELLWMTLLLKSVFIIRSGEELNQAVDRNVRSRTCSWRLLTVKMETIFSQNKNSQIMPELKKLRDKIRYADPMGGEGLEEIESAILSGVEELPELITREDLDTVKRRCEELCEKVLERSQIQKLLK